MKTKEFSHLILRSYNLTRFEKIFFISVISIEFCLIIFLVLQWRECKRNVNIKQFPPMDQQITILSSFQGTNKTGEKEWIHFTSYSPKFYILGVVSSTCPSCESFIEKWNQFFSHGPIGNDIYSVLLTEESFESFKNDSIKNGLIVSRDDIMQFGFNFPSLFVVNGRGAILFNSTGYADGLFEEVSEIIFKNKYRKSTDIQ